MSNGRKMKQQTYKEMKKIKGERKIEIERTRRKGKSGKEGEKERTQKCKKRKKKTEKQRK